MKNYTDQFIEVPFTTYDGRAQELTGADMRDVETIIQWRKIDPFRIEYYEQAIPANMEFDKRNLIATEVNMYSGNRFVIAMPVLEFEKKLNEFHEKNQPPIHNM